MLSLFCGREMTPGRPYAFEWGTRLGASTIKIIARRGTRKVLRSCFESVPVFCIVFPYRLRECHRRCSKLRLATSTRASTAPLPSSRLGLFSSTGNCLKLLSKIRKGCSIRSIPLEFASEMMIAFIKFHLKPSTRVWLDLALQLIYSYLILLSFNNFIIYLN